MQRSIDDPGYWCVVCGRFLPEEGEHDLIVHDDVDHPLTMDFNEESKPQ